MKLFLLVAIFILEKITRDIWDTSGCFSILADETTAVPVKEQLTLCVRFVSGTGKNVYLREFFCWKYIEIQSLIEQTADGDDDDDRWIEWVVAGHACGNAANVGSAENEWRPSARVKTPVHEIPRIARDAKYRGVPGGHEDVDDGRNRQSGG